MTTIDDQLSAQDVVDTAWSRYTEWFIVDQRTQRVGNRDYIQWKNRIREFDALYRGDWATVYPDEELKVDLPKIQNLIQTGTDDQARLVSEVQPDIHCPPRSDKDSDIHDARIREAILETYWVKGRGELYIPWLTQDLCATGIALLACVYPTTREGKALRGKYPYPYRLDPRGAFPDVLNGVLQDVIVLQRIRRRQAEVQFGFPLSTSGKDTEDVEVIDYYVKGGMMRVITGVVPEGPIGKPYLYSKVDYGIDCVPVAFSMLPAADGNFRGLYDQAKGPLATQNRLVTLAMEYADQAIYAPWEEFGVTNNMEKPGPNTVYHKIDKDSGMTRVQPAVSSPQLFEWMQLLDQSSRGVIGRPASREGEISQCLAPNTRVLKEDLTWVPVGELKEGQRVVGFDEQAGGWGIGRHFRSSEVTSSGRAMLPSYRVTLEDGTSIIASSLHRWLVRNGSGGTAYWATTENLANRSSHHLPDALRVMDVWEEDSSWESGYLAGFFDGEGSLSRSKSKGATLLLTAAQRENAALRMAEVALLSLGFDSKRYSPYTGNGGFPGSRGDVSQIHLRGGREETMRFLGTVRPRRLLDKWDELGASDCVGRLTHRNVKITAIEFVGEQEVVTLGTTTKTLIAEGFAHHNSIASGDFVNATQGALTTQTRFLQRLIGDIRKQWNEVALETDEKVGGSAKKALSRPVGKEYDYVPKKAISGYRDNSVVYGAGAGLDYINRKQAVLQELGALLISKDTARGMMDDIIDPEGEARKIERESIQDSLVQRVLSSGDTMAALKLLNRVGNGETFADAAGEVAKEMEAAQQQQMMAQQQQAAGTGTQGSGQGNAAPPGAETPEAPPAPQQEFQPQVPSESIMVRGA